MAIAELQAPACGALWTRTSQRLRFTLGEFRLFSWSFPALVLNLHFTRLGKDDFHVPFERLNGGVQALVIPSFPFQSELPRVTRQPEAIRYVPWRYQHYYIELLAPSFSAYLQGLTAKTRHEHLR